MRIFGFTRGIVDLGSLHLFWVTVVICLVVGEVSGDESSEISKNVTDETSGRGSRQLWSLVKNVIKTGLDQGGGNGAQGSGGGGNGGFGSIASGVLSAIAGGINSNGVGGGQQQQYYQQQQQYQQNLGPGHFSNPNDYMHYLLMNSQSNQHASLPYYLQQQKKEQESTVDLIEKYKEQMAAGSENVETAATTGNQILNKLALGTVFDDFDKVTNLLSFARIEGMVEKVNKFDKLKCIPRLLCQMVSKRKEDEEKQKAKKREDEATTKKPTNRKVSDDEDVEEDDKKSRKEENEEDGVTEENKRESKEKNDSEEDDEGDDDDDEDDESDEEKEYVVIKKGSENEKKDDKVENGGKKKGRSGRFLNLNGSDTALEQFVRFLDLMQLKDWSLYPYLNGAYQGHQVSRAEECAYRFSSCPFSDEQLVYYFNNYNGGFFQSI